MSAKSEQIFKNRKPDFAALTEYGFCRQGEEYRYEAELSSGLRLSVSVSPQGEITDRIVDPASGEEYTLHLVEGAAGSFVGEVKEEYERILLEIAECCFIKHPYHFEQTAAVLDYAQKKYQTEPEFLWEKYDNYAVLRRTDTEKWYAVIMVIPKSKLGFQEKDMVEIIDLRAEPAEIPKMIDKENYFPGWHMNKKSWYTVILDGTLSDEELFSRIDQSYHLAIK